MVCIGRLPAILGHLAPVGMVVLLVAAGSVTTSAAQTSATVAALTIRNRACPVAYEESVFYGDCHDADVSGVLFSLEGAGSDRAVETGADGNVTFRSLAPGTYSVRGGPPSNLVRNVIFCAPWSSPDSPYPFTQTGNDAIAIDLSPGVAVICDWYSVPANLGAAAPTWRPPPVGQTLTIAGAICPAGYTGTAYAIDCAGVPAAGAQYLLASAETGAQLPAGGGFATADVDGTAKFALGVLVPGKLVLREMAPHAVVVARSREGPIVSCASGAGSEAIYVRRLETRAAGQIFELRIETDANVHCDFFYLPLASGPSTVPPPTPPATLPNTGTGTSPVPPASSLVARTLLGLALRRCSVRWSCIDPVASACDLLSHRLTVEAERAGRRQPRGQTWLRLAPGLD